MARPRTIDREQLLDAAERLLSAHGAAALSFGSLASAAGVPKASVQSAFGTRENMIDALLDRWTRQEEVRFNAAVGNDHSARGRMKAHIDITAQETDEAHRRIATLLATLAGSGEQSLSLARWYASRVGDLSATDAEAKRLRIAFLATEGAYFLRHLVGYEIDEDIWQEIFAELQAFTRD